MANFTQKAIKDTFISLLEERPLSDITVKNIVETCGINRNSFYFLPIKKDLIFPACSSCRASLALTPPSMAHRSVTSTTSG